MAALLMAGPATAQVPGHPSPYRFSSEQIGPVRPSAEGVGSEKHRLRRAQAGSSLKLELSNASYFMRAGARLTGVGGSSPTFGDVNNDGNLDLLVTGNDANIDPTATLYLGDGSGGFTERSAELTGVLLSTSSFGDVNSDGALDLLITGRDPNGDPTATLYLGNGSGGFTEQGAGLTGVQAGSSSIGDVDGNGTLDFLITGRNANDDLTATLYLGDGSGEFTAQDAGLTGVSASSSSIGDVDNDDNLDLLITGRDSNSDPTATLYLGDGSGGFTAHDAGLTGVSASSSSFADVDNDGNLDLLLTGADANIDPTATLYLGDGSGGFTEHDASLTGVEFGSSIFGDVDGDGTLDLLITGRDANDEPTTTLYLGDGSGGLTRQDAGLSGVVGGSSSFGDVDADGDTDLVITGYDALFGTSARVYINRTVQEPPNQPPTIANASEGGITAPGRTITRIVEAGDPDGDELTMMLKQGSRVDGVSFTDAGNGVAEIVFTPPRDLAGQNISFTVEASDGNGSTATSDPITVEVGDKFALLDTGVKLPALPGGASSKDFSQCKLLIKQI